MTQRATRISKAIVVEDLDFRGGGLSRELNVLLSNCCRHFLDAKLKDLHEKFGIEIVRVDSAFTSQECSACGNVAASNRKGEEFKCGACGHAAHADENAALCIRGRRPLPGSKRLAKGRSGFAWEGAPLPAITSERWAELKAQGIRFPPLWDALAKRKTRATNQNGVGVPRRSGAGERAQAPSPGAVK